MFRYSWILGLLIAATMTSRIDAAASLEPQPQISASWRLIENFPDVHFTAELKLTNRGRAPLDRNWTLYFNSASKLLPDSVAPDFRLTHINGDFYALSPGDKFEPIKPNESRTIAYGAKGWAMTLSYATSGLYWIAGDPADRGNKPNIVPLRVEPFPSADKLQRGPNDIVEVSSAESRFQQNEHLHTLRHDLLTTVTPTPVSSRALPGQLTLKRDTKIVFEPAVDREAKFLATSLSELLMNKVPAESMKPSGRAPSPNEIRLRIAEVDVGGSRKTAGEEAYQLTIDPKGGVEIVGTDPTGVFYGIQTLRALLPVESFRNRHDHIEVAATQISDAPRFHYRGLHLDVARNFHSLSAVKKLIDLMAFYKLNRFHLHLSDDEGWRIEITSLPELTQVGGRRGHTLDDTDRLMPSHGSGPFADPAASPGSGFYSQADFIELLRYADERHISVIPEIDLPGHARAAIKSMAARSRRLQSTDPNAAQECLLTDPSDTSHYESVQMWHDNVVDVGRDSTYHFIETVVSELTSMYRQADVPLVSIHLGGDEVPDGAWEKSPACTRISINAESKISRRGQMELQFLNRASQLLLEHSIQPACWEDCLLLETRQDSHAGETRRAAGQPTPIAYVWNSVWGWGQEDTAYRLANAGFDVVLCSAPNFYFDLACAKDPQELGYCWAGFVNVQAPFHFSPLDAFQGGNRTVMGQPVTNESLAAKVRLTDDGARHVLGIQGELWSENLRSREALEYMAFPRAIALAERAWAAAPDSTSAHNSPPSANSASAAWNEFANRLGQREMPRLDYLCGGVEYRLPPPGATIRDGKIYANVELPGLTLRYTTDGTEPTGSSSVYSEPITSRHRVMLKSFDSRGRGSRSAVVPVND